MSSLKSDWQQVSLAILQDTSRYSSCSHCYGLDKFNSSNFPNLFSRFFGTVPWVPSIISITVTLIFHNFFNFLVRFCPLPFIFALWSVRTDYYFTLFCNFIYKVTVLRKKSCFMLYSETRFNYFKTIVWASYSTNHLYWYKESSFFIFFWRSWNNIYFITKEW